MQKFYVNGTNNTWLMKYIDSCLFGNILFDILIFVVFVFKSRFNINCFSVWYYFQQHFHSCGKTKEWSFSLLQITARVICFHCVNILYPEANLLWCCHLKTLFDFPFLSKLQFLPGGCLCHPVVPWKTLKSILSEWNAKLIPRAELKSSPKNPNKQRKHSPCFYNHVAQSHMIILRSFSWWLPLGIFFSFHFISAAPALSAACNYMLRNLHLGLWSPSQVFY